MLNVVSRLIHPHVHTHTHAHPAPTQAAHQQQAATYGLSISHEDVLATWFKPTGKNGVCNNIFGNVLERFHREERKEAGTVLSRGQSLAIRFFVVYFFVQGSLRN